MAKKTKANFEFLLVKAELKGIPERLCDMRSGLRAVYPRRRSRGSAEVRKAFLPCPCQ